MEKLMVCLLSLILLFGCLGGKETAGQNTSHADAVNSSTSKSQVNQSAPADKPTVFMNLSDRDFFIEYPDWEHGDYSNASIIALRKGVCMLNVDRHNASITPLFNWIVNLTLNNENITLLEFDPNNHTMVIQAPYKNITFRAHYSMMYCNHETYVIGSTCAQGFEDGVRNDTSRFLSSAHCAREYAEPNYSQAYALPSLDNTTYSTFEEQDYSSLVPDWSPGQTGDEGVYAYTQNACNIILNRYNAPSENVFSWVENYIESNSSMTLVHKDVPEKDLTYDLALGNLTLRVRMRAVYCNYQSYNMIAMCEQGYFNNNSDVLEKIVNSGTCAKDYSFAPLIKDVEAPPPEEEERIAKTDAGLEYGINAENVVAFFNSNPLFMKMMKKYDKVNLRIYDEEEGVDIRLKALLEDGKITGVEDGAYGDAAFTFMMPLDDALNIFSNADRITLGNLLSLISNVETDPPEMLKTLIADAFRP